MKTKEIFAVVQSEMIKHFSNLKTEHVTMEADAETDLGLDSLDKIEMVMIAEEKFNIDLRDDEVEEAKTVGDLVKIIKQKVG